MRIAIFVHSLLSDWNHGNAHFLRGLAVELGARGHEVVAFEARDAWSLLNLVGEEGGVPLRRMHDVYPMLRIRRYDLDRLDVEATANAYDLVIAHEWSTPELIARLGRARAGGRFKLLFYDTHHRAVSDPQAIASLDLARYDGVLAFGQSLADVYADRGLARRVFVLHEAADPRVFRPLSNERAEDIAWIGNFGDEERTAELQEMLLDPARALGLRGVIHGVRYPAEARRAVAEAGLRYGGYLPNFDVPDVFSRARVTVHVPRRYYTKVLPGIPTIRVFEALACGIPLVCAPWEDREHLFSPGADYLVARDGAEMKDQLRRVLAEPEWASSIAEHGRLTVLTHHTVVNRADDLLRIAAETGANVRPGADWTELGPEQGASP